MVEAIVQGFLSLFHWDGVLFMLLGVTIGNVIGILPGIGSMATLAMLLPFIYGLSPTVALTFLLSITAANSQGGSLTAILFNVPGSGPSAATMLDGHPLAQQGKAVYALSAVLLSSALGGLFGGAVCFASIPIIRPLIMAFGSPELFFFVLIAITFIAVLGRGSMLKGAVAGLLGLTLALFGCQGSTGVFRFTFGTLYLEDGIDLIPLVIGIFAIPEVIELMVTGTSIAAKAREIRGSVFKEMMDGFKAVFRHFSLFIRCSVIGTLCGIIPGVGGDIAVWVCYSHAKQTSKHPELFGTGIIEGVIAPESAQNAKEGGALLTTLAFGLPGSSIMAMILAAFLILGIIPGPKMLETHLVLSFSLAWTIILANCISSVSLLVLTPFISKVTLVGGRVLAPFIILFIAVGAYANKHSLTDVWVAFLIGIFGYFAKITGFNRPALILGFILGALAEKYFLISVRAYGLAFIYRPISLILLFIALFGVGARPLWEFLKRRKRISIISDSD